MNPNMDIVVRDLKQLADVRQQLSESILRESAHAREKAELIAIHQQQVASIEGKVALRDIEVASLKIKVASLEVNGAEHERDAAAGLAVFAQIKDEFKAMGKRVSELTKGLRKKIKLDNGVAAPPPPSAPQPAEEDAEATIAGTDPAFVAAVAAAAAAASAVAAAADFAQQNNKQAFNESDEHDLYQRNEQAFNELNQQPNNNGGVPKKRKRVGGNKELHVTNGVA